MSDTEDRRNPRKELRLKLLKGTHAGLKIQACKLQLSMQAILEELTVLVVQEDPYLTKKLQELYRRKQDRTVRALSKTDAESLLDHIEEMKG